MDEDITQRQKSPGCIFHTSVVGNTAEEIELAALDEARPFFGEHARLEVVKDYQVSSVTEGDSRAHLGKKYTAGVRVRTVEP
jgi:hypothetical protein